MASVIMDTAINSTPGDSGHNNKQITNLNQFHPVAEQNLLLSQPCNNPNYVLKKHKCSLCEFRSIHRWVVKRHWDKLHQNKKNTMSSSAQIITAGNRLSENASGIVSGGQQSDKVKFLTLQTLTQDKQSYDVRLIENFKIFVVGVAS